MSQKRPHPDPYDNPTHIWQCSVPSGTVKFTRKKINCRGRRSLTVELERYHAALGAPWVFNEFDVPEYTRGFGFTQRAAAAKSIRYCERTAARKRAEAQGYDDLAARIRAQIGGGQ